MSIDKKRKFIILSNHYIVWNKYLNNDMKNQMSSKLIKFINMFIWKIQINIICFYIDDMLILDSNNHMIKSTKKLLIDKFDIKNLNIADIILEIQISKIYI